MIFLFFFFFFFLSLSFLPLIETGGSPYVAQAGLEFLGSSDSPASASQIAGITGMHHHTWIILYS